MQYSDFHKYKVLNNTLLIRFSNIRKIIINTSLNMNYKSIQCFLYNSDNKKAIFGITPSIAFSVLKHNI